MAEHIGNPSDPSDLKNALLGSLVENCQFLAFRPDRAVDGLDPDAQVDLTEEFAMRTYSLDGLRILITADYPDSGWRNLVQVDITGRPERDELDEWFVRQYEYKINRDMEISEEGGNEYRELEILLLPEYYEPIKTEVEKRRAERRSTDLLFREATSIDDRPLRAVESGEAEERSEAVRKAIGFNVVGDEESLILIGRIQTLKDDPDKYEIETL